jgi:hypothetical protein
MRPVNFPTVRLAQLAATLYGQANLFAKICLETNPDNIRSMLCVTANDYWHYRYRFGEPSPFREKTTGTQLIDSILVNTVIPFLHAYNRHLGQEEKADLCFMAKPIALMKSVAVMLARAGLKSGHASDTQAILNAGNHYCRASFARNAAGKFAES